MTKLLQKKSQNYQQKKQLVERIAYLHTICRKSFKICTISAPACEIFIRTLSNLIIDLRNYIIREHSVRE